MSLNSKSVDAAGNFIGAGSAPYFTRQYQENLYDTVAAGGGGGGGVASAEVQGTPTLTVAAQAGTTRDVTIQLKDAAGVNLAAKSPCVVWFSNAALGAGDVAPANIGSIVGGTVIADNGFSYSGVSFTVLSDVSGVVTVRMTYATATSTLTKFVNVIHGVHAVASAAVSITNP